MSIEKLGLSTVELGQIKEIIKKSSRIFKTKLLIKTGNKIQVKQTNEVAYFFSEGKSTYLVTKLENRKHLIDYTLEELQSILDPELFFRISRKFIVHIESIYEIKGRTRSNFEVRLHQPCEHQLHVSRDRAKDFIRWLEQ